MYGLRRMQSAEWQEHSRCNSYRRSPELPVRNGGTSVEGISTFVPFSIGLHVTNFIGEQFWGRAARASLTRKSRGACFILIHPRIAFFPITTP